MWVCNPICWLHPGALIRIQDLPGAYMKKELGLSARARKEELQEQNDQTWSLFYYLLLVGQQQLCFSS